MKNLKCILTVGCCLLFALQASAGNEKKFFYEDAGRCDPFFPLVGSDGRVLVPREGTAKIGDLQLEGILWDGEGNSLAIINNQVLTQGESIGNFKIIKINKNEVVLSKNNDECVLKLSDKDKEE